MRIKQLNSYILATVKVSPTFSASSVLFQVCEQYIQSFLFSTSWLASFVYCASGDLCLAFWHWHPAVAFRAGIEGESPSPAPSYCTGHLLFSRLFWCTYFGFLGWCSETSEAMPFIHQDSADYQNEKHSFPVCFCFYPLRFSGWYSCSSSTLFLRAHFSFMPV